MARYNSIHRQQLFHWAGSHIDERAGNKPLSDALRLEYVNCLREELKNGLWVKTPLYPDYLGRGDLIKVHRPITCFTEWTLGQSLPHTSRYGRLGFGFPKQFVLARGGQPVTYVRDAKRNDPYTVALLAIAEMFQNSGFFTGKLDKKLKSLPGYFDYIAHFYKRIKKPVEQTLIQTKKKSLRQSKKPLPVAQSERKKDPYARSFGKTLHYLEEREWRIVYDFSLEKFFKPGPGGLGRPDYYLPFRAGRDLFTVVVPDNNTLSLALQDGMIRRYLLPTNAPHVTVLSIKDIGTF